MDDKGKQTSGEDLLKNSSLYREFLAEKEEILKLVKGYHPSTWSKWADRFANALGEVSPTTGNMEEQESSEKISLEKEE